MADFGVTAEGYVSKTQEDMNAEVQVALEQVTDPSTGESLQANLSDPSDIVSQILAIAIEGVADGFLVDQAAYNQFDPGKATEDALSSLVEINGLERKPATKSTVLMNFTGDASTQGTFQTDTMGPIINFFPPQILDGEFSITIDGDQQDIVGLGFSSSPDYDVIALEIQNALQAVGTGGYIAATAVASSTTAPSTLLITTGTLGGTVSSLSPVGGGLGTDVSDTAYLNGQSGIVTPGVMPTVLAGFQFSDSNRIDIWETKQDFTFDLIGEASGILSESVKRGGITANAATLTVAISTSDIINTLFNPLDATIGRLQEKDNTLRRRRDLSTLAPSIGLVGSLDANLKAIEDVTFSRVYNNITLAPDANGIAAKSIGCVLVGGEDAEIAQVIFERVSTGSGFSGTTTVQIVDKIGTVYDIKFFRATPVPIDIRVSVTLQAGAGQFPDNGADLIKQALVDYSVGGAAALGITEGFDIVGFPPGQAVLHTRLFTAVNSIPGHTITFIEMKKTADAPPFVEADIPIAFDEVSDVQFGNIEVLVT